MSPSECTSARVSMAHGQAIQRCLLKAADIERHAPPRAAARHRAIVRDRDSCAVNLADRMFVDNNFECASAALPPIHLAIYVTHLGTRLNVLSGLQAKSSGEGLAG